MDKYKHAESCGQCIHFTNLFGLDSHVQMKEIRDEIIHFEQLELAMEKEWAQLKGMQSQLFEDKLKLLQQRAPLRFSGIIEKDKVKL